MTQHFTLDKNNRTFYQAADFILNGMDDETDIVFLTGKAGTGKTTFLKYIADNIKNKVILAPTGIAAINAGGQTIHSFFHLSTNTIYTPDNPNLNVHRIRQHLGLDERGQKAIEKMELLIIDEVSMVRVEILDAIDRILRFYRKSDRPFGGIPTLLIGDVFQLPPVLKANEKNTIYAHYRTEYFFSSFVYKRARTVFFELDKVYRQDEQNFLCALNHIRIGKLDLVDMSVLNERVNQQMPDVPVICLYPKNAMADGQNQVMFDSINHRSYVFNGIKVGVFDVESMANVDETIHLKVGAQIMTTVNIYAEDGSFYYFNGSIGIITAIDRPNNRLTVKLADNGKTIIVEPYTWKNVQQTYDEEKDEIVETEIGSFTQLPVRLAWALTIHKSQGLTLERAKVSINRSFAHGQAYVALSRCRSLSGLYLEQPIGLGSIVLDQRVVIFYNAIHEEFVRAQKESSEVERLYDEADKSFEKIDGEAFIENICKARKINNYLTKMQHKRYAEGMSMLADEYRLNKILAVKAVKTELRNKQLQEELTIQNNNLQELNAQNTELLAKCETMEKFISDLESKNTNMKNDLVRYEQEKRELSKEFQILQKAFIEKTLELDRIKKDPWYKRLFKIGW